MGDAVDEVGEPTTIAPNGRLRGRPRRRGGPPGINGGVAFDDEPVLPLRHARVPLPFPLLPLFPWLPWVNELDDGMDDGALDCDCNGGDDTGT